MNTPQRKRANVYFDGFNFYHGCFNSNHRSEWNSYKWLNIRDFVSKVFPKFDINCIRYFTALVNPTPDDPDKRIRQQIYIRALETLPKVTIHYGRFAVSKKKRWCADPVARGAQPIMPPKEVLIIEQEEKGSDVNLASFLLIDAYRNEYDVAIIVSNDSDLATPIKLVRSVFGKQVALLNPRAKTATDLRGIADYYRSVRLGPLKASQFPPTLFDEHGQITKPSSW